MVRSPRDTQEVIDASVFFWDPLQPLASGLYPSSRPAFLRGPKTSAAVAVN
jgi:hypothetical protein